MSSPEAAAESPHFQEYWQVIRSRWPIIFLIFALALGSGYFTTVNLIKKMYGSTAQVRILRQKNQIDVFKRTDGNYFDPVFFQSEIVLIQSKTILIPVINHLHLTTVWAKRYLPGQAEMPEDLAYTMMVKRFARVEPVRGSNVLEIHATSEDPQEAANIANEIASVYLQNRKEEVNKDTVGGLGIVRDEIEKQKKMVEEAQKKVEDLRKSLGVDEMGTGQMNSGVTDLELQNKSHMMDDARFDFEARRVRYEQLKGLPADRLVDTLPALGLEDQNLMNARQQQLQVDASLAQALKSGLDANHPKIQALQSQLEKLNQEVTALATGRLIALEIDLKVSEEKFKSIAKEVDDLKLQARNEKSDKFAPFHEAQEESHRQLEVLNTLKLRATQEDMDRKEVADLAIKISDAVAHDRPEKPILWLNLLLSGVLGLGLGLGVVFFIEYLDTSVKSVAEAEKVLRLPVLAVVPTGVSSLVKQGPDCPQAECYRILRAKLNIRPRGESRTLTAISSGPGEGKSTTLFNLAYICAEAGEPVLLIDADLRLPTQHRFLSMPVENGLAEYLVSGGSAHDFIKSTPVPNLYLMSAGDTTSQTKALFNEESLTNLVAQLEETYRVILIDSPPALGIGDASVIARVAGQTIFVMQYRRFPREVSSRALKSILDVGGKVVGLVLNSVPTNSHEGYYHYAAYSNYYHKKGGKSSSRPASPSSPLAQSSPPASAAQTNGTHSSETF